VGRAEAPSIYRRRSCPRRAKPDSAISRPTDVTVVYEVTHARDLDGLAIRKSDTEEDYNVVLYHRKLHASALEAMGKNPNTNRREAVEKLVTAAGGKLVAMYGIISEGPGAMVIFEADPGVAPTIAAVAAASGGVTNVKAQRLLSGDEVRAARQKRVELQKSYRAPGQ